MSGFGRGALFALFAVAVVALPATGPARAQTSINAGKTPPQLFGSDCAMCHKTAQGLAKSGPLFLQDFLRKHYTASRETAQALADYLAAVGEGRASAKPARPGKPREGKPRDAKPGTNPADDKASAAKASASKPGDAKPSDAKPSDAKPSEEKPAAAKPADAKPAEAAPAKSD